MNRSAQDHKPKLRNPMELSVHYQQVLMNPLLQVSVMNLQKACPEARQKEI